MSLRIITADERLAEARGKTTIALFGPSGVGKTSLLRTLPPDETLCIDLEAGMKSVQDWPGMSILVRTFADALDIAYLVGGVDPAADPNSFFSEGHYRHVCQVYAELVPVVAGNQARLTQPIPVVYGRHRVFPDLAVTPWAEYSDNDQYLHQLHCIGQGEHEVEQIRIEDTPIASFEEIETEIVPPGGSVTLFETDVVNAPQVAGQELIGASDRETAVTTNDAGEEVTTVVGDGWIGPFTANPAGTEATGIGIDVVMPRGLYYANDNGSFSARTVEWEVEARAVDDNGTAIGEWIAVASESVTAAENTPQRKSYRYTVTAGRYEVRVRRTNDKSGDARAGHELRWGGLKTFLDDTPEFGAVTLLAVKMRATDNLSQRSARLVNAIVTRKLPVWDPEVGWSEPWATRSLAWAFADAARSRYGAGLVDARIDLEALHALDAVWETRGDRFDAVFDQGLTVWEALTRIARCGRSLPFLQGGILRIARDAPRTHPVALFGPRNIVKGSFRVQYVMPGEDTADAVTVTYFSERTWNRAHGLGRLANRGIGKMGVFESGLRIVVPEKPADGEDGLSVHEGDAGIGMTQIVQPDVRQVRFHPYLVPEGGDGLRAKGTACPRGRKYPS